MNKKLSKKMCITIILLTASILISSGYLTLKVFIWNEYNEATYIEKEFRNNLEKVKENPENMMARSKLIEGFYKKGLYEEAKVQAEYVIEHETKDMEIVIKARYYRSLLSALEKNYEEAEDDLLAIIDSNENHGEAWISLGRLYLSMGNYRQAEEAITRANMVVGDAAEPIYLKGHIHFLHGDIDLAESLLTKAVSLDPNHLEAKQLLEEVTTKIQEGF